MTGFAASFRELVVPLLRQRAKTAGFQLFHERWDFGEGFDFVMSEAGKRGAYYLADNELWALRDWISGQMLGWQSKFETEPEARAAYVKEIVG